MKFKTKISVEDYIKLNYILFYRRGMMIFLTIVGVLMLLVVFLYYSGIAPRIFAEGTVPFVQIIVGFSMVVGMPILIYFSSKKSFLSNLRLNEEIEYDFTYDKMKVTGESFSSELNLDKTFKIQELKDWFLVYQNNIVFNPIPKHTLNSDQITQLRNIFKSLKNISINLK